MGTRGVYGFRVNGKDKVTYNHFDSYPSSLGLAVAEFASNSLNSLKTIAESIVLVDEGSNPTPEQIQQCIDSGFYNDSVSTGSTQEWYCLLRETQGKLDCYFDILENENAFNFMTDGSGCLEPDTWCEWAYIINVDEGTFEMYNSYGDKHKGRYKGWNLLLSVELDVLDVKRIEQYEENGGYFDEEIEGHECQMTYRFTVKGNPAEIQDQLNTIARDMEEVISCSIGDIGHFSWEVQAG